MGVLWRCEGLDKSGKTNVAVGLALGFFVAEGYQAFTNMQSCVIPHGPARGQKWAQTVTIDDLLEDVRKPIRGSWHSDGRYHPHDCDCGAEHARICNGVFIFDEAHTWLDPRRSGSSIAGYLTAFMMQAGKRNLLIIYTTHLAFMVMPFLRELTSITFKCDTPDKGKHIFLDVCDENAVQKAIRYGRQVPPDSRWVFRGSKVFGWYDPNEPVDPFAYAFSKFSGRSGKATRKALGVEPQRIDGQALEYIKAEMQGLVMSTMEQVQEGLGQRRRSITTEMLTGNLS